MEVGFGSTVLARGLRGGGIDGIGSYTRELGSALIAAKLARLTPVSFGAPIPAGLLPGAAPGVVLRRYAPMAGVSASLPVAFPGTRGLARAIDLYHSTDHRVPRLRGVPVLATVMDAIPLSHPQWIDQRWRGLKAWLWRRSTQWADHIVTISEYSRREIVEHFGVCESDVTVIPLGVGERHFEPVSPEVRARVRERYGLPPQYFLFVGTLQPRKNLERVLEAHRRLPGAVRREFPLVLVGRAGWNCQALVEELNAEGATGAVRWLQYLPDTEVQALMQGGRALVFPSLCEGFGLPVVEAFAAGLPVITSSTTALPEVAGDAALLVDPEDTDAIAQSMQRLAEDTELAASLRERGRERVRQYRWDTCARMTAEVYARLAG